jgi:hypothetical protein
VKRTSKSKAGHVRKSEQAARALLPALAVVGGSLVALPAYALELGNLKVHSSLGQPLRASIAYALAPNEIVSDTCVSVQQVMSADRLPSVGKASLIVSDGVIAITGSRVVQEPLMSMRVTIDCPYTPHISREYTLFVDPVSFRPASDADETPGMQAATAPPERARSSTPVPRPAARREPIGASTRYRVRVGDSLSEIAQRIENRPVGLWPAVTAIFEANPDAFIDNDPNKLKAGSWLDIPDFGAGKAPVVAERVASPSAPASEVTHTGTAYEPGDGMPAVSIEEADLAPAIPATETASGEVVPGTAEPAPVAASTESATPSAEATDNPFVDMEPGDVVHGSDSKANAAGVEDRTTIPDTSLEGPQTTSSTANVPVAVIRPPSESAAKPTHWLVWLIGGGIALIGSLLLFGRFRDRFGSSPAAASPHPLRRHTDADTQRVEALAHDDAVIADDSPTAENLALDADLEIGTGLSEGTDVDIAQDFAFASTTALDLELPEEMSSGGDESRLTDVLPPLHASDMETILESEVLPGDADDYDMSVIMDATKVPLPEDITERDLEAVALPSDDEALITDDYTVSQEVDYKILEQDYEDEMTATQALNAEIARAAEDLAARMEGDTDSDSTEISMASVHELDVTAQLRGGNDDDVGDLDDTGINEQTVSLDAEDKTVEMDAGAKDKTAEMPVKKRRGA